MENLYEVIVRTASERYVNPGLWVKQQLADLGLTVCTKDERVVLDAMSVALFTKNDGRTCFADACQEMDVCEAELARREVE
jgi:hypothetical protein